MEVREMHEAKMKCEGKCWDVKSVVRESHVEEMSCDGRNWGLVLVSECLKWMMKEILKLLER